MDTTANPTKAEQIGNAINEAIRAIYLHTQFAREAIIEAHDQLAGFLVSPDDAKTLKRHLDAMYDQHEAIAKAVTYQQLRDAMQAADAAREELETELVRIVGHNPRFTPQGK